MEKKVISPENAALGEIITTEKEIVAEDAPEDSELRDTTVM